MNFCLFFVFVIFLLALTACSQAMEEHTPPQLPPAADEQAYGINRWYVYRGSIWGRLRI